MNLLKTTTLCSALALTFAVAIPASHAQLSVGNSTGVGLNTGVSAAGVNAGVNTGVRADTGIRSGSNNVSADARSRADVDAETRAEKLYRNNTSYRGDVQSGVDTRFEDQPSVTSTSRMNSEVDLEGEMNVNGFND